MFCRYQALSRKSKKVNVTFQMGNAKIYEGHVTMKQKCDKMVIKLKKLISAFITDQNRMTFKDNVSLIFLPLFHTWASFLLGPQWLIGPYQSNSPASNAVLVLYYFWHDPLNSCRKPNMELTLKYVLRTYGMVEILWWYNYYWPIFKALIIGIRIHCIVFWGNPKSHIKPTKHCNEMSWYMFTMFMTSCDIIYHTICP